MVHLLEQWESVEIPAELVDCERGQRIDLHRNLSIDAR